VESLIPIKVLSLQSLIKRLNLIGIMIELVCWVMLFQSITWLTSCWKPVVRSRRHQNMCSLCKQ